MHFCLILPLLDLVTQDAPLGGRVSPICSCKAHPSPGPGAGAHATEALGSFWSRGCPTLPMDTKGEVRMEEQGWGDSGPVEEVKAPQVLPALTGLPAVGQHGPLLGIEGSRVLH